MAKANPKMRVSEYFKLERDQTTLDFVDVPIGNDTAVFLDPSRLRSMQSEWASECNSLLQFFFETLLEKLKEGDKNSGIAMLEALTEKNEFHLGLSRGLSDGRAFGAGYADKVWDALLNSKAGKTGLLKDIEDTCLFIEGVGPDRVSDAVCNIIRGPLIAYTQDVCNYYGIPLTQDIDSGPVWNAQTKDWEDELVSLPTTPFGKLLLVPKIAVRHRLVYDYSSYYTHHLLPAMQLSEKKLNSGLVQTLKDGRKRVTKISLRSKYGADKLAVVEQTLRHPDALEKYRENTKRLSYPITHQQLAEIENISAPKFDALLDAVVAISPGKEGAVEYENAIEKLLSALFFPSLTSPNKQEKIHDGRKRIDITYVNNSNTGFFSWLHKHYPSSHIFIECKNYGKEIGNPEFDQLAGRFSPSRGQVGFLICRSVADLDKVTASCIDTRSDGRGYIVVVTDDDLKQIVAEYISSNGESEYPLLRSKFKKLIF
jgi:hypothetical protein